MIKMVVLRAVCSIWGDLAVVKANVALWLIVYGAIVVGCAIVAVTWLALGAVISWLAGLSILSYVASAFIVHKLLNWLAGA